MLLWRFSRRPCQRVSLVSLLFCLSFFSLLSFLCVLVYCALHLLLPSLFLLSCLSHASMFPMKCVLLFQRVGEPMRIMLCTGCLACLDSSLSAAFLIDLYSRGIEGGVAVLCTLSLSARRACPRECIRLLSLFSSICREDRQRSRSVSRPFPLVPVSLPSLLVVVTFTVALASAWLVSHSSDSAYAGLASWMK